MTKLDKMAREEAKKRVKNIVANDHNEQRIADAALEIVQSGIADIYMTGFRAAREMSASIADCYPKGAQPTKLFEHMNYSIAKVYCPAMADEIRQIGEDEVK